MNFLRLFIVTTKAIMRNGFRTFLTMLGIIIGVASVITMMAIGEGARLDIQESISKMGANMIFIRPGPERRSGPRRANVETLTMVDVNALRDNATLLSYITPMVAKSGQSINGSNNWPTSLNGVNPSYLSIRKMEIASGEMFTERQSNQGTKVCVLGTTVAENLFGNEDPVGQMIRFGQIPMKVLGVLESKGENSFGRDQDDIILAPFSLVQRRILATTYVNYIFASTLNKDVTEDAIAEVDQILRATHNLRETDVSDFNVRSQQELGETMDSTSRMLTILLSTVAGISLFVGGIGIMNIMYVSVTERTREIGLRMAVGASGRDILLQFIFEAILISVIGGVIGMVLGVGAIKLIDIFLGWPTVILPKSIILSFSVCFSTGVFFGWYPALKASRLNPIDALRYE